ncbi:YybH family protein [Sphingomonas sp. GCM10030256]|uniref:YybH family protein n=1 Tax=Sphingomonas sp. GCM10030256 TaxID=3273427 RepID=UPI00361E7FE9
MRIFMPGLVVISAAALSVAPCRAAPATEAAQQELNGAAAAMDAAWDRKDLTGFATLFAQDATIQAGPNSVLEGQAAIRAFFGRDFENRRGTMRHVSEPRSIDMVTPYLALVDKMVRLEQQDADGRWTVLRTFLNSTLLTRVQGTWKIRAIRAHIIPNG